MIRLGIKPILSVIFYKYRLKYKIHPVQNLNFELSKDNFFNEKDTSCDLDIHNDTKKFPIFLFGNRKYSLSDALPDWFSQHIKCSKIVQSKPWWKVDDFKSIDGDIKILWELSRMHWSVLMAQHYRQGSIRSLTNLNLWLKSWVEKNPPYLGPNWKCGQEASIRVINIILTAKILNTFNKPTIPFLDFCEAHLIRIDSTLDYAIAQKNNHGTSEAVALYTGGSVLLRNGRSIGKKFQRKGLEKINQLAKTLINEDGEFSQYSTNYHRLMLETMCFAELIRSWCGLESFSDHFYFKLRLATAWLYEMVDIPTGKAFNLGANDGANLFHLTNADYDDYRPCLSLAYKLFQSKIPFELNYNSKSHLRWLGFNCEKEDCVIQERSNNSLTYKKLGSIVKVAGNKFHFYLRFPYYEFRPSQCDQNHFDLWFKNINILVDSGTYSYNTTPEIMDYFQGSNGHNNILFDNQESMPKISRFLRSGWLRGKLMIKNITEDEIIVKSRFKDCHGSSHSRMINVKLGVITIRDRLQNFRNEATLQWRLAGNGWYLKGNQLKNNLNGVRMTIASDKDVHKIELCKGLTAHRYLDKSYTSVFKLTSKVECLIQTIIALPI